MQGGWGREEGRIGGGGDKERTGEEGSRGAGVEGEQKKEERGSASRNSLKTKQEIKLTKTKEPEGQTHV